jgi:hypothetical protein
LLEENIILVPQVDIQSALPDVESKQKLQQQKVVEFMNTPGFKSVAKKLILNDANIARANTQETRTSS